MPLAIKKEKYSYADYVTWPDGERWEIIGGEAWNMTPAPTTKHQRIVVSLTLVLGAQVEKAGCIPFVSPTDAVLDDHNVVQPDFLVVCDKAKVTPANIRGAPDLIVEVLSPATRIRDMREKRKLYECFGVREYLIFHPEDEMVERFRLVAGRYEAADIFNWDETMTLDAFPEITFNLRQIFDKELPGDEDIGEAR